MKQKIKLSAIILAFIIALSSSTSLCLCQTSSTEQTSSTKQATQNLYLTFLTSVLNINLTKYTVGQSDYFVSYPPKFGGTIREEYFSYLFNSGLGTIDTWSVFDNGRMSVCSIRTTGQVLYTQAPAGNIADATNAFFRQYKTFVSGSYSEDSSYLQQALTSVSTVNMQQSADKLSGDMELTVSPPSPSAAQTSIQWAYSQNNITDSMKNINLIFANNTIIWFGDTWNLYSVSNVTPISENKAESIAFNYAKSYNVIVESIQTPTASYVQVKPDWSNMTYEGELLMTPGLSLQRQFSASRYYVSNQYNERRADTLSDMAVHTLL